MGFYLYESVLIVESEWGENDYIHYFGYSRGFDYYRLFAYAKAYVETAVLLAHPR
jgi:hypothetical protein